MRQLLVTTAILVALCVPAIAQDTRQGDWNTAWVKCLANPLHGYMETWYQAPWNYFGIACDQPLPDGRFIRLTSNHRTVNPLSPPLIQQICVLNQQNELCLNWFTGEASCYAVNSERTFVLGICPESEVKR